MRLFDRLRQNAADPSHLHTYDDWLDSTMGEAVLSAPDAAVTQRVVDQDARAPVAATRAVQRFQGLMAETGMADIDFAGLELA